MNFFFFFFFFTSCDRRFVEKSPVNSFISCKKIWLPSRITSQPFERDRPSDAVINLLDRISRKIFRVTCIPTQRLVPTISNHTISGLDLKRATVAGKRIRDANRPEENVLTRWNRATSEFFPLFSIFSPFNGARWNQKSTRKSKSRERARGYRERSMITRWRVDRPTSRIIPYKIALSSVEKTSRMWSRNDV